MPQYLDDFIPGVKYNGVNARVYGSSGNTTLSPTWSGSTMLFDTAAGITYTLPKPSIGAQFNFIITATVTSSNHKIITDASTTFMQGILMMGGASDTAGLFHGNGTSHVAITMNGTTTGGILGTEINLYCLTSTLWEAEGVVLGSNIVTPWATS